MEEYRNTFSLLRYIPSLGNHVLKNTFISCKSGNEGVFLYTNNARIYMKFLQVL